MPPPLSLLRHAAALLTLLSLSFGLLAQQAPPAPAQPYTLRTSSTLVLVPTEAQTKSGEMLYGLKPSQFVLEDNGQAVPFRVDEDTDSYGLALVVLVQCSRGAFMQFDRMRGLATMVDSLVGGAPRQVALVSYGGEPTVLAPFSADPGKLARGFADLQPCDDGAAATLDAVRYATDLLDQLTAPRNEPATSGFGFGTQTRANPVANYRRAILLVSETRDHGSQHHPEEVVAGLTRSNTVLDAVSYNPGKTAILDSLLHGQFGPGPFGLLLNAVQAVRKNVPHSLAALTGGEYTNFSSQNGFDAGLGRLANHIHNFYLLSFTPPAGSAPGLHQLSVHIPDYPDARIRSRLAYYYGLSTPPELPDEDTAGKGKR